MGAFSNVTVTDAGLQLINEAIAGGQAVTIVNCQVGTGYPVGSQDPRGFTALLQPVMYAESTSSNAQVLYQTTVRLSVMSANALRQFQLNEIGIFAQIGTGTVTLFAYASCPGTGDTITPAPGPNAVVYDYAILIEYDYDSPVNTTITLTAEVQLHASTHRGDGIDPIGVADASSSGALAQTPNDLTKVALGSSPQSWGAIPRHAPTHLDNGIDPIPLATPTRTGLMPRLNNDQSSYLNGQGAWAQIVIPAGVMWDFAGAAAPSGWFICDGSAKSRTVYAALYSALGGASSPWGQGDGSSTFNIPDFRGRMAIGAGQGAGLTNRALGANGGAEQHALAAAELANHNHSIVADSHTHTINEGGGHTHPFTNSPHNHALNEGGGHNHNHIENTHNHGVNEANHNHISFFETNGSGSGDSKPPYGWSGSPGSDYTITFGPGDDTHTIFRYDSYTSSAKTNLGILPATTGVANQPAVTGATIGAASITAQVQPATTSLTINPAASGIQLSSSGNNAPFPTMAPFAAANKIIKY
jgi:microcystin-dependent protein